MLQAELGKTREEMNKLKQKLEKYSKKSSKGGSSKKEEKPIKEVPEEEESKPLGNDIYGRQIQGEPVEPIYVN